MDPSESSKEDKSSSSQSRPESSCLSYYLLDTFGDLDDFVLLDEHRFAPFLLQYLTPPKLSNENESGITGGERLISEDPRNNNELNILSPTIVHQEKQEYAAEQGNILHAEWPNSLELKREANAVLATQRSHDSHGGKAIASTKRRLQHEEEAASNAVGTDNLSTYPANAHDDRTSTNYDSKICNCKRSACKQLYCDCFAAELYCTEACACQGCLNRPQNKKFLLGIKKQKTLRDPFAFASKIVQDAPNIPSNITENDNLKTPPSARQRKGCNCRRSRCLQKYCECFKGKVGCSGDCRCDSCENYYGRRRGAWYRISYRNKSGYSSKDREGSSSSSSGLIRG